ncbi:MAG: tol-pal system protein YbgF [Alphaproteobacteria bacterium]
MPVAILGLALAVSGGVGPVCAQSGELAPVVTRLERLEADLNALQKQVYRGEKPSAVSPASDGAGTGAGTGVGTGAGTGLQAGPVAARLQVKLSDLETQIQELTGRVEEIAHGLERTGHRIDTLQSDLEMRLSALERQGGRGAADFADGSAGSSGVDRPGSAERPAGRSGQVMPLGVTPNPSVPPAATGAGETADMAALPGAVLPPGSAEEQYNHAFSLVIQADYEAAEKALAAFLAAHGTHDLASNAAYWRAETFYVRKNFAEAAVRFAESYKQYPDGTKAPDSLLKLGMSLASLEKTEEACKSFAELARRYPEAPARIQQHASRERARLGCP